VSGKIVDELLGDSHFGYNQVSASRANAGIFDGENAKREKSNGKKRLGRIASSF
jgi:hypothetical protein